MTQNQKDILKRIIQVIIIIILLISIWYIAKDWLRPRVIKALGGYTAMEQTQTIDTLETKLDSIYFEGDSLRSEVFVLNKGKVEKDKTIKYLKELLASSKNKRGISIITKDGKDYIEIDTTFNEVADYSNDITDTLIEGNIKTTINLRDCNIVAQSLNYKPKFPIFITKTVTVEKTNEKTLFDKPKSYIGLGVTTTSDNGVGGLILYQTPSKWQFQGGYIKDLSPSSSTKGKVQVGIIKLF